MSFAFANFNPHAVKYTVGFDACPQCKTKFPPVNYKIIGGFVTVHGRKIWVEKYGAGSPAVILLNGGGDTIRQWNNNIPAIAKFTTVIAYDRQGLGRSELINLKPRTAKTVVDNLQLILKKIHVKPPYVLVGHSVAGFYVEYFARKYPKQVAGAVTIDANDEFQVFGNQLNTKNLSPQAKKKFESFVNEKHSHGKEQQAQELLHKKNRTPKEQAQLIEGLEVKGKMQSAKEIEALPPMPHVPLIVLTKETKKTIMNEIWHASIQQFAQEVPCSIFKIVPNSGHYIMIDQPSVVNNDIYKIVMASRNHQACP